VRQGVEKKEINELHLRFASYFSTQAKWAMALHHYIKSEAWEEAVEHLKNHGDELLQSELPEEIVEWLDGLPNHLLRTHGHLTRLRAEAYVRLGELDAAIHSYQEFLAHKQVTPADAVETARYYQELAEVHHKKGELGEALGYQRMGMSILEDDKDNLDALQAYEAIGALHQKRGSREAALRWGGRILNVAQKLRAQKRIKLLPQNRKPLGLLVAFAIGGGLWQIPPPTSLDESGMHFLASLVTGVILWMLEIFDQYVVALMLLLSWIIFGIVPPEVALAGFSRSSWFFVLGVLGLGAAVTKTGLLYRLALQVLHRIPMNYRTCSFVLALSGLLVTPLLPDARARLAIIGPVCRGIYEIMGFKPRSNGSAGITLSAYTGFGSLSFMYLTGTSVCLIGWSLLPELAKSEFGWGAWVLAALPAGIFTLLFLLGAIHLIYRVKEQAVPAPKTLEAQLELLGSLTGGEWLSITVLVLALGGWVGKPFHGISESWVALGAFLVFLMTGVLDKKGLKNNIDWGYLLFLGIVSSLAIIMPYLKIDRWIMEFIAPIISTFSLYPAVFLVMVALVVYFVRFFLNNSSTLIFLSLILIPAAQSIGIHPGVLLLTILMAIESWFLPYQGNTYLITYYSTDEKAFSHAQARKLMVAKFISSLLAIAISVPYWRMLGLIR
jgi:anion transporter